MNETGQDIQIKDSLHSSIQSCVPAEMHFIALKNKSLKYCVLHNCEVWRWLFSHLSLLDNVVGVTAREASTLQEVHDIIFAVTIIDTSKPVMTWMHTLVISCDYRSIGSALTAILTSPSSYLRSTGPSWRRWHAVGRLPLCQSERGDICHWSWGVAPNAAE